MCYVEKSGFSWKVFLVKSKNSEHIREMISHQVKRPKKAQYGAFRNRLAPKYLKGQSKDETTEEESEKPDVSLEQFMEVHFEEAKEASSSMEKTIWEFFDISLYAFPDDCIQEAAAIPIEDGFDQFSLKSSTPIMILEVYSPYRFWFGLMENGAKVATLQAEMNEFYAERPKNYKFPTEKVGFACAAYASGHWRRAILCSSVPDLEGMVKVFLIDNGVVVKVYPPFIRCLAKQFAQPPRQAMRGRLAQVQPLTLKWRLLDVMNFKRLLTKKVVFAKLEKYDVSQDVSYLSLEDATNLESFDVGTKMVEMEWAGHCELDEEDSQVLKYPTFEHVEAGMSLPIID